MLTYLTWVSKETSPRLTTEEVEVLAGFTLQLANMGHLNNGKYVGATTALYWERTKGSN